MFCHYCSDLNVNKAINKLTYFAVNKMLHCPSLLRSTKAAYTKSSSTSLSNLRKSASQLLVTIANKMLIPLNPVLSQHTDRGR